MAPTVCMPDFPEVRRSHSYSRRRQKNQNGSVSKRQKMELKKLIEKSSDNPEVPSSQSLSPISQSLSTDSIPIILRSTPEISTRIPSMQNNHWKMVLRRDGLLDIFVRTIALVKRNNILQRKVRALREETENFISTVINNPENKAQNVKENLPSKENDVVSSTTETNSRTSSPFILESRTDFELNRVTSSSEINKREDNKC